MSPPRGGSGGFDPTIDNIQSLQRVNARESCVYFWRRRPYIKDIFAKQTKASPENTLFIAFGEETCAALKSAMPEYKVYWLTVGCRGRGKDAVPIKANAIISTLKRIEADGVDCRYHPDFTTPEFIAAIKKAGFEFHAWTVDDLSETIEVFRRGADSVTTNCAKKQLDAWNTAELMIRAQ